MSLRNELEQLRRTYGWKLALNRAGRGLLVGALGALLYAVAIVLFDLPGWNAPWVKLGLILLAALVETLGITVPSTYALAKQLDDTLGWNDLLSSAYALEPEAQDDPMVAILVEDARQRQADRRIRNVMPGPGLPRFAGAFAAAALAFTIYTRPKVAEPVPQIDQDTRKELQDQVLMLDELLKLEGEDLTDEEKHQFEKIRKMIEELQLEDKRLSRKELLARFSREIEGLEDMEQGSEALKKALEQLKETKAAIANRVLLDRQVEEIEKQQTELAVVDEKGEKLKAEEIEVMVVQDARRKQQEAMAKEMRKVAEEEAQEDKVTQWAEPDAGKETPGEQPGAEGTTPEKKKRVIVSYDDLVKAAEQKNIREMIFKATSDPDRSSSEYKEVYFNYRRAFTNLLYQGNLSLGTRQYLKRYFRAIRPKVEDSEKQP